MQIVFEWMSWSLLALSFGIAAALIFITAPYGRFSRRGWGPLISSTVGWVVMELPAACTIFVMWLLSDRPWNGVSILFLLLWETHYVYRTFIFPFRRRGKNRQMPVGVVAMAIVFNVWNGFLNGAWLFHLGPVPTVDWLGSAPFLIGLLIFGFGMFVNHQSDNILLGLRKKGEEGYHIPHGGFYRWVSMPAYLGELIEWSGFAILTWSPAAALFAVFTAANLIPRALSTHKWYVKTFADYPKERKAILPFLL